MKENKINLQGFTGRDAHDLLDTPEKVIELGEGIQKALKDRFKAYDQAHAEALVKAKGVVLD